MQLHRRSSSRGHQVNDISQGEMDDESVSVCVYWHSCVPATVPQPNNSGTCNKTQLFRYHARLSVYLVYLFVP